MFPAATTTKTTLAMSSSSSYRDRDNRRDSRRDDHRDRDRRDRDDYESRGRSFHRGGRGHSPSSYDAEYESRRFRDRRDRDRSDKYPSNNRRSRSRENTSTNRRNDNRYEDESRGRGSTTRGREHNNSYSDDNSSSRDYNQQQKQNNSNFDQSKEAPFDDCQNNIKNKTESDEYLSKLSDEKLQESYDRYENDPSYDITDGLLDNIVIDKEKIHTEMQERLRQHLLSEGKVYPPPKPEPLPQTTAFANDGSFMDMFKKMQEQQQREAGGGEAGPSSSSSATATVHQVNEEKKKPLEIKPRPVGPMFGKRRGGKILKTGIVEKKKPIEDLSADAAPGDAWSQYMKEVKRYKAVSCDVDNKNRPLVK